MPSFSVDEIKKALKLGDGFTMETLIQYLKIDSYELVKNLSRVVNSSNASETIAYRDGALSRNEVLIKLLSESIKSKTFTNRLTGEIEATKPAKKG